MSHSKTTPLQSKIGIGGSPLKNYCRSVLGQESLVYLFFYECINLFCISIKGKFGVVLRQMMLPFLFNKVGKDICFGVNCTIRNGKKIFIGDYPLIGDSVTLDVKPSAQKLKIGDQAHIGKRTIFNCHGGIIEIGDNAEIGAYCRLGSLKGLRVGNNFKMEDYSCISGASHLFDKVDIPIIQQPLSCKGPTAIGDNVTFAERVTILDGVTIGNNVKVLPDSLVNKDIADNLVVSGVPAKVVQEKWENR